MLFIHNCVHNSIIDIHLLINIMIYNIVSSHIKWDQGIILFLIIWRETQKTWFLPNLLCAMITTARKSQTLKIVCFLWIQSSENSCYVRMVRLWEMLKSLFMGWIINYIHFKIFVFSLLRVVLLSLIKIVGKQNEIYLLTPCLLSSSLLLNVSRKQSQDLRVQSDIWGHLIQTQQPTIYLGRDSPVMVNSFQNRTLRRWMKLIVSWNLYPPLPKNKI